MNEWVPLTCNNLFKEKIPMSRLSPQFYIQLVYKTQDSIFLIFLTFRLSKRCNIWKKMFCPWRVKETTSKVARKLIFSLTYYTELPKRPKQKISCSKIWLYRKTMYKTGVWANTLFMGYQFDKKNWQIWFTIDLSLF